VQNGGFVVFFFGDGVCPQYGLVDAGSSASPDSGSQVPTKAPAPHRQQQWRGKSISIFKMITFYYMSLNFSGNWR
jgi:hypothetical protein